MSKLFTPSSTDLLNMIKAAEAKCSADIEQTRLRDEARAEQLCRKCNVRRPSIGAAGLCSGCAAWRSW